MPSLLLLSFLVQLVIHIVNTVGGPAINSFLWSLWNKLPTRTSADYTQSTTLRREAVRLKRELNTTSAQDQFAKWAKLQRQHDKAMGDYERKTQTLRAFESSFNTYANALRWVLFNGLRFFLQSYYQRTPMYWLPRGWVPGYVEWLLAFPRAPTGSVSVQVWFGACMAVIQIATAAVGSAWALRVVKEGGVGGKDGVREGMGEKGRGEKGRGEPMMVGAGAGGRKEL